MQKKHIWNRVPATAALFIVGALGLTGVACGTDLNDAYDMDATTRETMKMFDVPGLTFTLGTCAFSSGTLTITPAAGNSIIVGRESTTGGNITINGNNTYCQNANYANVTGVTVAGGTLSTSNETVVLDFSNGYFGLGSATVGSGISIDLGSAGVGGDKDMIQVRMQNLNNVGVNQNVTIGNLGVHLMGTSYLDITFAGTHNPNTFTIALGGGNDRVNAAGDSSAGLSPANAVAIYGNGGNDTIYTSGANFNDIYSGGNGNDTIVLGATATAATGHYAISGGNGLRYGRLLGAYRGGQLGHHGHLREWFHRFSRGAS